jgi:hypothetical protein
MLVKKEFLSDGSWTCPAGVTNVILYGYGGGGSGAVGCKTSGSGNLHGGGGGGGALARMAFATVVPNTTYTITIGPGGAGVTAGADLAGKAGNHGGDTTFGSLATFRGGGGAYFPENTVGGPGGPGIKSERICSAIYTGTTSVGHAWAPGVGGCSSGATDSFFWNYASASQEGYAGGAQGVTATRFGGGGGAAGPGGAGTAGTNGSTGTSGNSSAAAANSGAGSGGTGAANTQAGSSGAGGSGKLIVLYWE